MSTRPHDESRLVEEFVADVARASDPHDFQLRATKRLGELVDADAAVFFARAPDSSSFVAVVTSTATALPSPAPSFAPGGRFAKWLRVNEETLVLSDRPEVIQYLDADERGHLAGLAAIAAIPVTAEGRLLAMVVLTSAGPRPLPLLAERLHVLTACGRQAALISETVTRHHQERLRLEAAARAQQLAVAGQLAAAVAHEVRNPLTTIRSSVQYVIDSSTEWSTKAPLLRQVMQEVDRINRSISGVLGLTRPKALELANLDLQEIVESALVMFQAYLEHHRLTLARQGGRQALPVRGDPNQLRQVLLNVLLNACQATPDGGTLHVSTETSVEGGVPAAVALITDTGPGMSAEQLARALEPFFTTKVNGTGLGLSICHDIMSRHEGAIRLASQAGAGTTVRLTLPLRTPDGPHSDR